MINICYSIDFFFFYDIIIFSKKIIQLFNRVPGFTMMIGFYF
jgi:hypothetical protein